MDPMLMQLLAARSGIPAEALLGENGAVDTSALLMNLLSQREQTRADDDDSEPEDPPPPPPDPAKARRARMLVSELQLLRRRSDDLAAALGACYLCWGSDAHCVRCFGEGRPGWGEVDDDAFREYVVPALRRKRVINTVTVPSARAEGLINTIKPTTEERKTSHE